MFTRTFLTATAERGIKTFAQALAAILTAAGVDLITADWKGALAASGMAALVSVLTSVTSGAVTDGGPSLTSSEIVTDDLLPNYDVPEIPEDEDF